MGMLARQLRKDSNQAFADPVRIPAAIAADELVAFVTGACGALNKITDDWLERSTLRERWKADMVGPSIFYRYYPEPHESGWIFVGYASPPSRLLTGKASKNGNWLASCDAAPANQSGPGGLSVRLLRWNVGDDGIIKNKDRYERFVIELSAAVGAVA